MVSFMLPNPEDYRIFKLACLRKLLCTFGERSGFPPWLLTPIQPCPHPNLHNDLLTTLMASDSSAYPLSHVLAAAGAHRCLPDHLSPAEAIADAWARESAESQKRWRAADTHAKDKFYAAQPWQSSQVRSRIRTKM
ncbi:hypothetical protein BDY19DRAFT_213962 [Irpex rosettiformis]|uniref:Uncharacterized protein n=1 Tax=Irpex rosettiformis TaxID=378272 RepID=A0ACB8U1N9_9APHY|nr:hypothetical protein BDY19DRAFT_213962 [Irpex rosettiformis]